MAMFGWTKAETVKYNSILISSTGILSFIVLLFYVWTKISKRIDNRVGLLIGIAICFGFHFLTYPWEIYGPTVSERIHGNNTDDTAQSTFFDEFPWTSSTPAVNVYFYNILYVILFGIAFPLINVHLSALLTSILGPRRQGTMQGINTLFASLSRIVGPIIITYVVRISGGNFHVTCFVVMQK
ncbi:hypothetical protein AB6A40_007812 [Gnathostoma spinigerum]|uniref:Uncharacterized protein n=1 Tax=Gnathostoma spinigerum TaxID=75299 RepID=A0ABD6EVN0_9BILA